MTFTAALRRFGPLLRPDRATIGLAALLLSVAAACEIAAVFFLSDLIDSALSAESTADFVESAVIWLIVTAVAAAAGYLGLLTAVGTSERFVLALRTKLYAHVQRLSPRTHRRIGIGDLVARHTGDIEAVEHMTASGLLQLAIGLAHVVGLLVVAIVMSWQVSTVAVVAIAVLAASSALFGRSQTAATRAERVATADIGVAVHESLAGLETTVAYNQQDREQHVLSRHGRSWLAARMSQTRVEAGFGAVMNVGQVLTMLAVAVVGAWQIRAGALSVGGLVALTGYLGYLYPKVQEIAEIRLAIASSVVSADRVAEILVMPPSTVDEPTAHALPTVRPRLELSGVAFGFDRPLLTDATLSVRPGAIVALVGASGSGKSTLAALITRLERPRGGTIRIDGNDIAYATAESVRNTITLLPQQVVIRSGTIADNIAFGRPDATPEQIADAARAADAHGFISALPQAYQTVVTDGGLSLSGGQRQRIAMARALIRDTPVLVLDEPTTGLDAESVHRVIAPIRRQAAGRATLVITHDRRLAAMADEVIELRDGVTRRIDQKATTTMTSNTTRRTTTATPIRAGEIGLTGSGVGGEGATGGRGATGGWDATGVGGATGGGGVTGGGVAAGGAGETVAPVISLRGRVGAPVG